MTKPRSIYWIRNDLRIQQNSTLSSAIENSSEIIPVFIWDKNEDQAWPQGGASTWWLYHSLKNLSASYEKLQSRLIFRMGPTEKILTELQAETNATHLFYNTRLEPALLKRDQTLKKNLEKNGMTVHSFQSSYLLPFESLLNKSQKPFQVFTPFWKEALKQEQLWMRPKLASIQTIPSPKKFPSSLELNDLNILPPILKNNWMKKLEAHWSVGEESAQKKLNSFIKTSLQNYTQGRDVPSLLSTSNLSPHLHFGEISVHDIFRKIDTYANQNPQIQKEVNKFKTELGWREFGASLLVHFPHTTNEPLRENFNKFPWSQNQAHQTAWQQGKTGYPLVDAGMRELWQTGWMHNRVRMIVGSFLVKHLRLHWLIGAKTFYDRLVDADLASNTLGWQWVAGSGADAAPYFRIFNPVLQGERFDEKGEYIRKWVPELKNLPDRWIHEPWHAPQEILKKAGVQLGKTYPAPIVDHHTARQHALMAFKTITMS